MRLRYINFDYSDRKQHEYEIDKWHTESLACYAEGLNKYFIPELLAIIIDYCVFEKSSYVNAYGYKVYGRRTGKWIEYYGKGTSSILSEGYYYSGLRNGEWKLWYENGKKMAIGSYYKGDKIGRWIMWYTNGDIMAQGDYSISASEGQWIIIK
jgi:hypothetical protein